MNPYHPLKATKFCFSACFALMIAGQAHAINPDWIVDSSGNTPGALSTIQQAVDNAQSGDYILVKPGIYNEYVTIDDYEDNIKIVSEVLHGAILDGNFTQDVGFRGAGWQHGKSTADTAINVYLKGFLIRNQVGYNAPYTGGSSTAASETSNGNPVIAAEKGWVIDSVKIEKVKLGIILGGKNARVVDTEIADILGVNAHFLTAESPGSIGPSNPRHGNVRVSRATFQGCNTNTVIPAPAWTNCTKILQASNIIWEHVRSENHGGSALWFDWRNTDYAIRFSTFAGQRIPHPNNPFMAALQLENNQAVPGQDTPGDYTNGQLCFNRFENNTDYAHIHLANTSNLTIYRNHFDDSNRNNPQAERRGPIAVRNETNSQRSANDPIYVRYRDNSGSYQIDFGHGPNQLFQSPSGSDGVGYDYDNHQPADPATETQDRTTCRTHLSSLSNTEYPGFFAATPYDETCLGAFCGKSPAQAVADYDPADLDPATVDGGGGGTPGTGGPTDIQLSNTVVPENQPSLTVGTLSASDPDDSSGFVFALVGGATDLFEISGATLRLKLGVGLDYETAQQHAVTVRVTDPAGNPYTETLIIVVENDVTDDAMDQPTNLLANPSFESGIGGEWQTHGSAQYNLASTGHSGSQALEIASSISSLTRWMTEYRHMPVSPGEEVCVSAYVKTGTSHSGVAKIALTFFDDSWGFKGVQETNGISGPNQPWAKQEVCSLSVPAGATWMRLELRQDQGAGQALFDDVFACRSCTSTPESQGTGGGGNQAPTDITLSNATVTENAAGATVGSLDATDPDDLSGFVFSLMGGATDLFEVTGSTLKLQSGVSLDFEASEQHTVLIQVADPDSATFSKSFTISVTNDPSDDTVGSDIPSNILDNGSFEDSLSGDWETHGSAQYTHATTGRSGARSLEINSSTSSLTRWMTSYRTTPVMPGESVCASVYVKTGSFHYGLAKLAIVFFDDGWGFKGVNETAGIGPANQDWTKQQVCQSSVPSGTTWMRVELRQDHGAGNAFFDDVYVCKDCSATPDIP